MLIIKNQKSEINSGQENVKELLSRTQLIVENSNDSIIGEMLDGTITSWNGGAQKMFGYSAREVIGKSVAFLLPPEMKDEIPVVLNKIKAGEIIADYDSVRVCKDGSKVDVSVSGAPIRMNDGTVIGASIVERNITKRKEATRRIEELNKMHNEFIAIISHQLRTPLTAVNWNLESLLNGDFGKLGDTQYQFLQATHEASLNITNSINDLLTAMDIEEGRLVLEKGEVSLESICSAVVEKMNKHCQLKKISLTYVPPTSELPAVMGDGAKIRTVFVKLIENAINYTKEGGKIDVVLTKKGNLARFEVKDTGVGIPVVEQDRIFTRFFRASNASIMNTDAFGLGLFTVKNFIEQHQGKIGFESEEGKGSTFWFEIPFEPSV